MTKITNELLKEAIADAESVRETAIANAKIQLEESIAPAIKNEITKALMEADEVGESHNPHRGQQSNDFAEVGESVETEGESVEEVANDATSGIGGSENKMPSPASSKSSKVGSDGGQEFEKFHTGAEGAETPQQMKEEKEEDEDEDVEEVNEGIMDLEAIIRELQAEVEEMIGGSDDEYGEEEDDDELDLDAEPEAEFGDEEPEAEFGGDDAPEAEFGDDEEDDDLDIEEILREIEAELSEEEHAPMADENARLKGELAEYRKAVELLRGKLNEVNLLNAKLLFTNKLFKNQALTNEQKVHVVETFDLATTLREVKLVYATLSEAVPAPVRKKAQPQAMVTEAIASNVVGSTAPKQEVIAEDTNAAFRRRMQELAGVKVL
jgi:hypothetical protein